MPKRKALESMYAAIMHKIQSIIAFRISRGDNFASPKHLRVGVNSALISNGALADVLIKKGIITEDEYFDCLLELAEKEANDMEEATRREFRLPDNIKFK